MLVLEELCGDRTGIKFKEYILDAFRKYGISVDHMYSITTNSGSNVVKAIELLENKLKQVVKKLIQEELVTWLDGDDKTVLEQIFQEDWAEHEIILKE